MKSNILRSMLLAGAAALALPATPAAAEDIFVPLFTYRTGAFAGSGIYIADGMHDYLTLLNERDGGIGGVKIAIEECETGYDTKKGLECYEAVKPKKPVMVNPWSTGTTLPLIPKAAVDKIPILSMAYGLSASAIGNTFPWIFNPPDTYWDGMSVILKYIASQEGGADLSKLKGKKIGYIYLDAGFGKEPLPFLEQLSKEYGFDVKLYPVGAAEMQNQSAQWLNVRRDKPDYMVMYGWGALQPTAIKEAVKIGYPMEKFISVWWPSEEDARGAGDGSVGFKSLNWHASTPDFPVIADIQKYVVDKGKSQSPKDKVGTNLYNKGVYKSMLIAEGIHNAQKITGKKEVNGEDVRRGLETMNIDDARLKELGMTGFTGPFKLTCTDHNSHRPLFVQRWDGKAYVKVSDLISPDLSKVQPLLEADAKTYAEKNATPARTEACDAKS